MLVQESLWFRDVIRRYVPPGSLVLNIGSSTREFIERDQPYIKVNLFDELANKMCTVKNVDLRSDEGVDLVGDVTDPEFVRRLRSVGASVIVCSNLLEHLRDRHSFCDGLSRIMSTGMLLLLSVPRAYPYHEDPIDTMYRPTLAELVDAFPLLELQDGCVVDGGYYFALTHSGMTVWNQTKVFGVHVLRTLRALATFDSAELDTLRWSYKKVSATCAVMRLRV